MKRSEINDTIAKLFLNKLQYGNSFLFDQRWPKAMQQARQIDPKLKELSQDQWKHIVEHYGKTYQDVWDALID